MSDFRLRTLSTGILAALVGIFAYSDCLLAQVAREYPVYRLDTEPVLDGIVDGDPAWSVIPVERAFVIPFVEELGTHLPAYKQTSFKIGYDLENMYVAILAKEPWTRYLAKEADLSGPFEMDDGVHILLARKESTEAHHFKVNAVGPRRTPENGWEAEVKVTDSTYIVEAAIPFARFGAAPANGEAWIGNLVRYTITVNSPEDRISTWSPVQTTIDDPRSFGRLVFNDEILEVDQVHEVEASLAVVSDKIMLLEEVSLKNVQSQEDALAKAYQEKVVERSVGLTGVTRGPADLIAPPSAPEDEVWRYGLGFPMQIGPTEAALLTNIRMIGSGNIDFEIGTDVVLFDDLDKISTKTAIPISRWSQGVDPEHGNIIVRKGPVIAGFVPYGALREDGSSHPHAGTGFGIGWAISHKVDVGGKFEYTEFIERYAMQYQFAYDGEQFSVLEEKRIDASKLLPDWNLVGNFVTNGIPDGDDLLYVMIARKDGIAVAGYTRWQHGSSGWHPVSFTPVTGFDVTWSEPSLIREADGSLAFSARSYDLARPVLAFDIGVWRSIDNGETWKQVIHEKNRRARSPVSINRTADGTPFVAANTPPLRRTREVLSIWPLDESRTKLEGRITARDAKAEFGPAPSGSWWRIDHPTSAVIRLADGRWHSILSYRIVDNGEVEGNAPPAPQTGCYVEEVFSVGPPVPVWTFDH